MKHHLDVTVPKAGHLIPAILEEISIQPCHLGELKTEVARRAGFPERLVDRPFPLDSNNSFHSKIDAAVAFLLRTNLATKLGRGRPLRITKMGRDVLDGLIPFDLDDVTAQIEPKLRVRGQTQQTVERGEGRTISPRLRAEAEAIAQKLSVRLPDMPLDGIYRLSLNAKRHLEDGRPLMRAAAALVLQAVDFERTRRKDKNPGSELRDGAFRWPSTEVRKGKGASAPMEIRNPLPEGMLVRMGYRVGAVRGESDYMRHRILQHIFEGDLAGEPGLYRESWGENGTAQRLKKLAYTIAALTRNAKRRDTQNLDEAIGQWEDDLEHLYERYYVGRFGFDWPSTEAPLPEQEAARAPAMAM